MLCCSHIDIVSLTGLCLADSITRSPLYSLYAETIAGVSVVRAFGASANTLRSMMTCVDSNLVAFYWTWSLNRWLSARFNMLSSAVLGVTACAVLWSPSISAATAGFALAFANTVSGDLLFIVRRFVALEQSMVAMERLKEYSELAPEGPEFVEPRPDPSWPHAGKIEVKDLVIKYAVSSVHHLGPKAFEWLTLHRPSRVIRSPSFRTCFTRSRSTSRPERK